MVNFDAGEVTTSIPDLKRAEICDISSSKSVIETVNGSHRFEIKGYSLAKGMGAGKYVSSDIFTVGGYDWAIYFYPDGKNPEDSSTYVSVFIALASDGTDVRALFELTLLDQTGSKKHKVHSHFHRALESGPYTLKYKGSMWGYKRFFRRPALESSEFLKEDCLVLECTVGVVRSRMERPKQYSINMPPSDMGRCFKDLFENEIGCDIVFKVGDDTFNAHKLVLAARSPVFKAQFFGLVGNPDMDTVVVEDVEPSIFRAMLLYIYSDSLPDVHEIMGSNTSCSFTIMVQHLLASADRFGLDRLKLICESKLCDEITVETVPTTLSLAEQHRCVQLKSACLKFAAAHLNVMHSEGFRHLEESCPSLLSELLQTVASVDDSSGLPSSKKRSSSSVFGLDLAAETGIPAESVNPTGRRFRRRL
ncbi:BTB/POZ and MATH domain-containing protein 3 isoform X2 [Beta vulgaris subsp. vulgaris]|uniref:BTB/POZ and MATH domain-containing protein 3 isoform X2 n=1 Tax=Beta vulgaris subsp. vulgaris TaxID=3555 RepID=UPI00053FED58|nr:BTB/POZ and MATH domain-containing protein 3 isoform X2 [Beta vulgaris subsp. vulgaris]